MRHYLGNTVSVLLIALSVLSCTIVQARTRLRPHGERADRPARQLGHQRLTTPVAKSAKCSVGHKTFGDAPQDLDVVDGFSASDSLNAYIFSNSSDFRFAAVNRLTIRTEQAPFRVTTVSTVFLSARDIDGTSLQTGFAIGDPVDVVLLSDASASGDPRNAFEVFRESTTVPGLDALVPIDLMLPTPPLRGDVYVAFVDKRSTEGGTTTAFPYFVRENPRFNRSYYAGSEQSGSGSALVELNSIEGVSGNLVIRASGVANDDSTSTGGGQPVDATLAEPTNLFASGDNTAVTLTWGAPGDETEVTTIAETEPNDSPLAPDGVQNLMANPRVVVEGRDASNNNGSSGGFCSSGNCDDIEDWFGFTVVGLQTVVIDLSGFGNTDFDLFLYNRTGPFNDPQNDTSPAIAFSGEAAGVDEHIEITIAPGDYVIGVAAFDPGDGVPTTPYRLSVVTRLTITGYNIFRSANNPVSTVAENFIGTVGPNLQTFVDPTPLPGTFYTVTTIYGATQSEGATTTSGSSCGTGVQIQDAQQIGNRLRGALLVTGSGFESGVQVLLNGRPFKYQAKVSNDGTRIRQREPLLDNSTIEQNCGSGCTITIVNPSGSCATFTLP